MQLKRRILMASTTMFLAAASGYILQSGTSKVVQMADESSPPEQVTLLAASGPAEVSLPKLPQSPSLPATAPVASQSAPDAQSPGVVPEADVAAPLLTSGCAPVLELAAAPAAMVEVKLRALCNANERVVLLHEGLALTGLTSDTGVMEMTVPALAMEAEFQARLAGGDRAAASVTVPDMADYDRIAVQWQGDDAFQLHAFEFGADIGDMGHVSAARPRTVDYGISAAGGFLTILGDDRAERPMLAEVYTFPSGHATREGYVNVVIEAAVTDTTCGRDLLAETLKTDPLGGVDVTELTVAMPACDAVGEFLVLKNLLPDLKIASR